MSLFNQLSNIVLGCEHIPVRRQSVHDCFPENGYWAGLGVNEPPKLKTGAFRRTPSQARTFPLYQEPSTVGVFSLRFQGLFRLLFPPHSTRQLDVELRFPRSLRVSRSRETKCLILGRSQSRASGHPSLPRWPLSSRFSPLDALSRWSPPLSSLTAVKERVKKLPFIHYYPQPISTFWHRPPEADSPVLLDFHSKRLYQSPFYPFGNDFRVFCPGESRVIRVRVVHDAPGRPAQLHCIPLSWGLRLPGYFGVFCVEVPLPLLPNQRVHCQRRGGQQAGVHRQGCAGDPAGLVRGKEKGGPRYVPGGALYAKGAGLAP